MGIILKANTKRKETLKLYNHINSFLFEQEFNELIYFSSIQKKALEKARLELAKVISNG